MECNREEAIKAKELAIQKFSDNEYSAAKKLALKAQSMCPELEGIEQFLLVLDVLVSSEVKIGDETDWYEVLGVSTSSDEATIRKQYKAKALALHPDKNNSVGSTDAFRLMAKAYEILSDRNLRAVHDAKRRRSQVEAMHPPAKSQSNNPNPKSARNQRAAGRRSERAGVFWTYCISCSRYLLYREIFRGHVLLCKCCKSPFVANEVASPPGEPSTGRRAPRNLRRTAASKEARDGPSGSNPVPKPDYFHHQRGFRDPSFDWAWGTHQGFSDPSFGWSWARQGFSSHGNPGSSSQRPVNDAQDSSWAHFYHHQAQQQWDPRGPEQGSAWVPSPQFFSAQMNMGSGPSFYNWSGSNVNLNANLDFGRFGSNNPSAPSRNDENSMKRSFETTEGAIDGREEARGDSNKKRHVREGCHTFGANFSNNDNNHGDDGGDRNRGDSSTKPSGLRIR